MVSTNNNQTQWLPNENCFIVILPTYNRANLLIRAIESIQSQKHTNWKCIVVNDGSSDNTGDLIATKIKVDSRIHYLEQSNQGVNAARNTGIEFAQSIASDFYFLFIDDDDYLHQSCFEYANASIDKNNEYNWHGFNCINTTNGKKISRIYRYGKNNYINDLMFGKNWRGDITSFIHNRLIGDLRYCKDIFNGEEWFFWSQLSAKGDVFINDLPGSYKDFLPQGLTKSGFNRDKAIQVIRLKVKILSPLVGEKKLTHQFVTLAKNLYQEGKKSEARQILKKVFKLKPLYLRQYSHWIRQFFY